MRNMIGALIFAGGVAMASLPAVAAPPPPPQPHVQFGLQFGGSPPPSPRFYDPSDDDECLSTREIIRDVRSSGYRSIRVVDDDGDVLTVRARLGYKRYVLELDDCSGDVLSRRRVY
jgi:hypothetical protein